MARKVEFFLEMKGGEKVKGEIKGISSGIKKEFKKAGSSVDNLGSKMLGFGTSVVAPFIGFFVFTKIISSFTSIITKFIETGDEIAKMSVQLGISVEFLSQMQFAAEQSGTSIEAFKNGIRRFTRNIKDANDGTKKAVDAFKVLKVEIKDNAGRLKPLDQLFLEVADSVTNMANSTQRLAVIQEVFGRSGAEMLPLLLEGADGIKALQREADLLGATLTETEAKLAVDAADALGRFSTAQSAAGKALAVGLLDILTKSLDVLTKFTTGISNFNLSVLEKQLRILKQIGAPQDLINTITLEHELKVLREEQVEVLETIKNAAEEIPEGIFSFVNKEMQDITNIREELELIEAAKENISEGETNRVAVDEAVAKAKEKILSLSVKILEAEKAVTAAIAADQQRKDEESFLRKSLQNDFMAQIGLATKAQSVLFIESKRLALFVLEEEQKLLGRRVVTAERFANKLDRAREIELLITGLESEGLEFLKEKNVEVTEGIVLTEKELKLRKKLEELRLKEIADLGDEVVVITQEQLKLLNLSVKTRRELLIIQKEFGVEGAKIALKALLAEKTDERRVLVLDKLTLQEKTISKSERERLTRLAKEREVRSELLKAQRANVTLSQITVDLTEEYIRGLFRAKDPFKDLGDLAERIAIQMAKAAAVRFLTTFIFPGIGLGGFFSEVFGFKHGGVVPNINPLGLKGSDTVPALLTPGEVVLTQEQAQTFNINRVLNVNNGLDTGTVERETSLSDNSLLQRLENLSRQRKISGIKVRTTGV